MLSRIVLPFSLMHSSIYHMMSPYSTYPFPPFQCEDRSPAPEIAPLRTGLDPHLSEPLTIGC